MISATATFAVLKHEPSPGIVRVLTVLTDLADIRPYDATAPALPTYAEAVRIVTERGLARSRASDSSSSSASPNSFPSASAVVLDSAEELDALAAAMV